MPATTTGAASVPSPSTRGALASLCLATLLPALATSIANAALPTLASYWHAPFQAIQWIVLAYLLSTTSLVVVAGRLGDTVGKRRLLVTGLTLFALASLLCACAPTLWLLVGARALQGAAAAVMLALSMAMTGEVVPPRRTGSAMGMLGAMSAVGTTLGPAIGGLLIASFGWRAIFLFSAALAGVALLLAARCLPPGSAAIPASQCFDATGTLSLAFALGAFALAMTLGRGKFGWPNLALLAVAGACATLFARVESKAQAPLVPLAMLRAPLMRASLGANALVSTVMMATLVVGPFYLGRGLGLDTATTGIVLAAGPLVAALCGVPAGRAVDRFGPLRMGRAGLFGAACACVALALLPASLGIAGYAGPVVVLTGSYALFQAANNTAVLTGIDHGQRGLVSGLLGLSRNLGLIAGAAMMGAVFALNGGADSVPAGAVRGMQATFAMAVALIVAAFLLQLSVSEPAASS